MSACNTPTKRRAQSNANQAGDAGGADRALAVSSAPAAPEHLKVLHVQGADPQLHDLFNLVVSAGVFILFLFETAADMQILLWFTSPTFRAWRNTIVSQGFRWPESELVVMYWHMACLMASVLVQVLAAARIVLNMFRTRSRAIVVPVGSKTTTEQQLAAAQAIQALRQQQSDSDKQQGHTLLNLLTLNIVFGEWPKVPALLSLVVSLYNAHAWCAGPDALFHDNFLEAVFSQDSANALSVVFNQRKPDSFLALARGGPFPPPPIEGGSFVTAAPPPFQCLSNDILGTIKGSLFLTCLNCIITLLRYGIRDAVTLEDIFCLGAVSGLLAFFTLHRPLTASVVFAQVERHFANSQTLGWNKYTRLAAASLAFGLIASAAFLLLTGLSSLHKELVIFFWGPPPQRVTYSQAAWLEAERRRWADEVARLRQQVQYERDNANRAAQSRPRRSWDRDRDRDRPSGRRDGSPRGAPRQRSPRWQDSNQSTGSTAMSHWGDYVRSWASRTLMESPLNSPRHTDGPSYSPLRTNLPGTPSRKQKNGKTSKKNDQKRSPGSASGSTSDDMTLTPHMSVQDSDASTPKAWRAKDTPASEQGKGGGIRQRVSVKPGRGEGKIGTAEHADVTHLVPAVRVRSAVPQSAPQPAELATTPSPTTQGSDSHVQPFTMAPPSPPAPPAPAPPPAPPGTGSDGPRAPRPPQHSVAHAWGAGATSNAAWQAPSNAGSSADTPSSGVFTVHAAAAGGLAQKARAGSQPQAERPGPGVQNAFVHAQQSSANTSAPSPLGGTRKGTGYNRDEIMPDTRRQGSVSRVGGAAGPSGAARGQAWGGSGSAGPAGMNTRGRRAESFMNHKRAVNGDLDTQEAVSREANAAYEEERQQTTTNSQALPPPPLVGPHVRAAMVKGLSYPIVLVALLSLGLCAGNAAMINNQLGWASGWMWSDVAASVIQAVLCCWIVYLIRTGDLMSVGPGQQPGQVHPV